MMHIILLILKIIGWVLLAVLGIAVLLVCAVIFTPLRYEIKGDCDGSLSGLHVSVRFSYFFHLVSGSVQYTEKKAKWKLKLLWKTLGGKDEDAPEIADAVGETLEFVKEEASDALEEINDTVEEKAEADRSEEAPPKAEEADRSEEAPPKAEANRSEEAPPKSEAGRDKKKKTEKKTGRHFGDGLFEKAAYQYERICDKIKELIRKKEIVMGFLTDEVHKSAFFKILSEMKRLLLNLKPKKLAGEVTFGFTDPSWTGKALAGISMLYPFFGEQIQVYPYFEGKVLEGSVYIKGSVAARSFLMMAVRLLWDKNVRMTIRHIKKFKLNETRRK